MVVIFVVGFIMCLIGGWFVGMYVDCKGCKVVLFVLVLVMCIGLLIIGLIFGYDIIGIVVFVLLVMVWLL